MASRLRSPITKTDKNYSINYRSLLLDKQQFDTEKTISLTPVEYVEDPNYLSKIIETGGKKIGYYVYNFFASGTDADSLKYDKEMDAVFANFKSQGITDFILDLRFNSGGSETAANNLASLIAPGADETKVFFKRQYNSKVQQEIQNDPSAGDAYLVSKFTTKSANIGNQLTARGYTY